MTDKLLKLLIRDPNTTVKTYNSDLDRYGGTRKALNDLVNELIQVHNHTVVFTHTQGRGLSDETYRINIPPGSTLDRHNREMKSWVNKDGQMGSVRFFPNTCNTVRGLVGDCVVLHGMHFPQSPKNDLPSIKMMNEVVVPMLLVDKTKLVLFMSELN